MYGFPVDHPRVSLRMQLASPRKELQKSHRQLASSMNRSHALLSPATLHQRGTPRYTIREFDFNSARCSVARPPSRNHTELKPLHGLKGLHQCVSSNKIRRKHEFLVKKQPKPCQHLGVLSSSSRHQATKVVYWSHLRSTAAVKSLSGSAKMSRKRFTNPLIS